MRIVIHSELLTMKENEVISSCPKINEYSKKLLEKKHNSRDNPEVH